MKVSGLSPTVGKKLARRTEGFSIVILTSTASPLAFGIVAGLILLYSNNLEGRQTVENHLVHMVTCYDQHNDIINLYPSSFFAV